MKEPLFPEWTNRLPLVLLAGAVLSALAAGGFAGYFFSPRFTDVGYQPRQPVAFSHALHAGRMAIDCRYCHGAVEVSPAASLPTTAVCMNCHRLVGRDKPSLEPLRISAEAGQPIHWVRVHDLPDYVFFDHSAHVDAGVGCVSCHGDVTSMEVIRQVEPLSMGWCLDCHRGPEPYLRPVELVTDPAPVPAAKPLRVPAPPLDCSGCHR